jgi:DNA-binding NarL/FixJ family response regulator
MDSNTHSSKGIAGKVSRILVVDDHPVLRYGICALLNKEGDLEVCGEAGNASAALEMAQRLKPDAAVIDISLPGTDGIELVRLIKRSRPEIKVLMLSMQEECDCGPRALRAGAQGYLMKDDTVANLVPSLRHVLNDALSISQELKMHILAQAEREEGSAGAGGERASVKPAA